MRVERSGNLRSGRGFLVAGILDCGGAKVLANLVMVPSPGVSGGEEAGMKANGLLVAAGAESTSSKRQRRPSVRLGEPSDHPASNILQNPPKRRRVQEEEEEEGDEEEEEEREQEKEEEKEKEKEEEKEKGEEEQEREKEEEKEREDLEVEQDEEQARKVEWEGVPDQEREKRERGRGGYHDVLVQGDFPFSGKVTHAKPRTRTLEHVASTASQSQRQRDAAVLAAGSGEPGLSSKESDGEGPGAAVEQPQANGDQASEQGLALALVVAAEKPVTGRRQQVSNGPAKRGKATRRGGRRGGSSASYKSIGGMLQTSKKGQDEKVTKAGKVGRQSRAGKAGKEKEAKQGKEGREGREKEGKEDKDSKDSKASETESVKKPFVEERQGREALPLPLPLPLPLNLLPPPPVPLAILPPPAASDKERESSDRGPLSSDATQSSFNEQGNGEEAAPNGGQQQQHGELQQEKMKIPLPLPLATRSPVFPPPETNGGKRDSRVKSTDPVTAVRQEGPRAEQPELTVGELTIKYLHRAAGAYTSGVRPWLSALGLGHHAEAFEQNEVDDEVLPLLTMEDLTEMRIPIGPKRKIFNAIQVLRDSVL